MSDLSITYLLRKKYDDALVYLKQAEQINPQDYIVLNNIAYCYRLKGNKTDAIKYYTLVKKYGPEDEKIKAQSEINKLK